MKVVLPHFLQEAERSLALLAFLVGADQRVERNHVRLQCTDSHLLQEPKSVPPLLSPTPGSDCHAVLFDVPKLSQILQALHNVIRSPAPFLEFIQKLSPIRFAAIYSWWLGF